MGLVHWEEVESVERAQGHIHGHWQYLGAAGGTKLVGCNRVRLEPGRWSTPAHVDLANEEIFYVLGGSGLSWQDGDVYEIREGDCIVHQVGREAHTLRAGDDGLEYVVFGGRARPGSAYLPRAGVAWLGKHWFEAGQGGHPWVREVGAGEPAVGEPAERPSNIVHRDDLEPDDEGDRVLAAEAGALEAGLHHRTLPAGKAAVPAHCHSAEEEIVVMLSGSAVLELIPSPRRVEFGVEAERHELWAGHVVVRPPGTGIGHLVRGGDEGATMLIYGTKDPNDIAYYPTSNKFNIRGIGLIGRIESLEYSDGEPEFGG